MTEAPRGWEEQIADIMSAIEDLREQLDEIRGPRDWAIQYNRESVERAVDQGGFYSNEDVHDLISTASIMQRDTNSVAIVDWTTIRNSCLLLEGVEPGEFAMMRLDPFLAFADLAALVGAAVFYDRVLVLSDLDWAWRANRALGLQDRPVVGIRSPTNASGGLDNVLTEAWSMALTDLNKAEEQQLSWIDWLRTSWKKLLPSTPFPSHGEGNYETRMGYGGQYNESAIDDRKDLVDLFRQSGDAWKLREDNLDRIILDNDLRALFYEYLATSLTQALSSTGQPITVNYVGGCLRSPLLLARARYAEACLNADFTVEGWLYAKWKEIYTPIDVDLEMPFWLHAAMASSSDRSDLSRSIGQLRLSAKSLRRTRGKLNERLRDGDAQAARELASALKGDAKAIVGPSDASAELASGAVKVAGGVFLPAVSGELIGKGVSAGLKSSKLHELALRLFRPHLSFIVRTGAKAASQEHTLQKAAKIFEWPHDFAEQPQEFLGRLTETTWIA